jgi:tRNA pseudouridine32 synthase/23S rRNA pseudouridine746 synthase
MMARDAKTHQILNSLFEKREVEKTYHGVTLTTDLGSGSRDPSSSPSDKTQSDLEEWRSLLVRGKKRTFEASHGKPSVTFARCLGKVSFSRQAPQEPTETFQGLHWELNPHTGRPHQLRYELAKRGCPIWGDQLYGGTNLFRSRDFIALRCISLKFGARVSALGNSFPDSFSTDLSLLSLVSEEIL